MIECPTFTIVYSGLGEDYGYNLRVEYEAIAERILCKKLASIKNNIDSSLSYIENLEQRYQGDDKKLLELIDNSLIKTKDIALDIQDNQYSIKEAIGLCSQAYDSVIKLQSFLESNDNYIASFKDDNSYVIRGTLIFTVASTSAAICFAPTSACWTMKETVITSLLFLPAVIMTPALFLYDALTFSSPFDNIGYAIENINMANKLLGIIEECNYSDSI